MKAGEKNQFPAGSGFYFITDRGLSSSNVIEDTMAALDGGAPVVQYREKHLGSREMLREANEINRFCAGKNVAFIVNNRIDLCLAAGASGVHLGQGDMPLSIARKILPGRIIGVTVHNLAEAIKAEGEGADYLGVSPIFATETKQDAGAACGPEMITEIKEKISLPVVAIGGITLNNLGLVLDAGAD